ncbi:hypothetical protein CRE_16656 [Caenorhabditis remanei]|uniref:Uncharacterized protein n=1 Tax=Caenorhabditis remanei TaxID=31234 RepID=E3MAY6_CAERE|nr:hypothetical protein CRE_16656 [Caenorhabditis remanei]
MSIDVHDDVISGFLVHYTRTHYTVFHPIQHRLMRGRISYDTPLTLGKYYYFEHNKFFVTRTNEIYARSWAVSPGRYLPQNIQEKFEGKVWAPFFGLLNDQNGMFVKKFGVGGHGGIVVKFVNRPNEVFKIRNVEKREYNFEISQPPIWNEIGNSTSAVDDFTRKPRLHHFSCARFALCVQEEAPNRRFNVQNKGSFPACSHLINKTYGAVRSMRYGRVGVWYQHSFTINNSISRRYSIYDRATATKLMAIDPPLPTKVVGNHVELTVKFLFNHDRFEREWSRDIQDWEDRRRGLKFNMFFYDEYLGKVEVQDDEACKIIKFVGKLRNIYKHRLIGDPIIVTVKVSPIREFVQRNCEDNASPLFFVHGVVGVEFAKRK